jgi:hypothetical protein
MGDWHADRWCLLGLSEKSCILANRMLVSAVICGPYAGDNVGLSEIDALLA